MLLRCQEGESNHCPWDQERDRLEDISLPQFLTSCQGLHFFLESRRY